MAEAAPVVHIGENSSEQVAFKLMVEIARVEERALYYGVHASKKPDRDWILNTYAECLRAVRGYRTGD